MSDPHQALPGVETLGDLLDRLGGIPAYRVRLQPYPGTATEADVLAIERQENRLCELVDAALVEKTRGYKESLLACAIAELLRAHVRVRRSGLVTGADGMLRLFPGLVRIPDVAFVSWDRIPGRRVPSEPIPSLVPDLAVEVLSPGNTAAEMARKRDEYFAAGVRLVWYVDPETRTAVVHATRDRNLALARLDALDGADVLPGFTLPLRDLFAELDQQGPA
ncbi:MAG: Uma2 family endonuclease [Planctomycetes bacterium]|nr:Uma2 family endonuclease [Planctomycetota bacterium]